MDVLDRSYEPMDVDISNNSSVKCEVLEEDNCHHIEDNFLLSVNNEHYSISTEKTTEVLYKEIKKLHVNLTPIKRKDVNNRIFFIFCAIIIGCISIIVYCNNKIKCNEGFDTNNVKEILVNKLYGQDMPIETITKALDVYTSSKILFLYGGTGVGKTYAVNLLLENLWNYSNVYHYTMPSFKIKFPNDLMTGLVMCPSSVFVVDGLTIDDSDIKNYVIEVIEKSEHLGRNITVFLIYNCDITADEFKKSCDKVFYSKLKASFSDLNVAKFFIKFNQLTKKDLRNCVNDELILLKQINKFNIDELLEHFDFSFDGCKGVHKRIKLLIAQAL